MSLFAGNAVVLRGALAAIACAALTACGSPSSGQQSGGGELSPQFLDMLAPLDGDSGARARESANLLLAQAESAASADCMTKAGFQQYIDLPVLNAKNDNNVHSGFVSPTKWEQRGIVSISDPTLESVPPEAQSAVGACLGEDGKHKSVATAVNRFVHFRDSSANPLVGWDAVVRAESTKIAQSNSSSTQQYRSCFRNLGIPDDQNSEPTDALSWLISDMGDHTKVTAQSVDAWERGEGVVDGDGGKLAQASATCFREFQKILKPRLAKIRSADLDKDREQLLGGQDLFYKAIGNQKFDPGGYHF